MKKFIYIVMAALIATTSIVSCTEEEIKVSPDGNVKSRTSENQW